MPESYFQDAIPNNYCWGCGNLNQHGLHIKSHWTGEEAVCTWQPDPSHMAGPKHILNGGIIATLIDCHAVCSAIADAYRREGRALGSAPELWYATANLNISYLKPTPIDRPLEVRARVNEARSKKTVLSCSLVSAAEVRARAEVVAVRVPEAWRNSDAS
jgi:acyl-coenzyme A thioesterase PaaI-like protein